MRRPSVPFLVVVGVLIGILFMALVLPDHATDTPSGPTDVPTTPAGVDRSEARP
jgi:hypothetical protein